MHAERLNEIRLICSLVLSVCLHGGCLILADWQGGSSVNRHADVPETFGRLSVTLVNTTFPTDLHQGVAGRPGESFAGGGGDRLNLPKGRYVPPVLLSMEEEGVLVPLGRSAKGTVSLKISVSRLGHSTAVQVIDSTLPKDAEQQIVAQFFYAKYRPAEIGGAPVAGEITVRIELDAIGGSALADPLIPTLPAR
jgi:hypothetical protein